MTSVLRTPTQDRTRALLLRDDRRARTELMLRLMYSSSAAAQVLHALDDGTSLDTTTAAVFATVDFRALAVERAARLRNLSRHLQRTCPPLWACLGEDVLTPLVEGYADAEAFWQSEGRTLFENFCLYAHRAVAGASRLHADVLQLFGLIGRFSAPELIAPPPDVCACTTGIPGEGLDASRGADSPWNAGHLPAPTVPGALQVEGFHSAWRLVDERGRLPLSLPDARFGERGSYHIVVAAFPGDKVSAAALEL
ncbi:hypothetical protein [Streptomyces sp. SAS_270]|uniref:hypothetical protein n=1 Tax=Streptomyces sp. SAS_270 TaxID=3412748 RepID=UPI00403C19A7